MNCAEAEVLVQAYVDGELAGADREVVDRHLDGCPRCAASARFQGRFKAAVRAHLPRPLVPRSLEAHLRATLQAARPAPRMWTWDWLTSYPRLVPAMAAAALLVLVVGSLRQHRSFVVEQARRTYQAAIPMDILGDCRSVASWFRGRVDFPLLTPSLDGGATCQGGRLVNVHERPAAYVVYMVGDGHRVGLLVFDPSGDDDLMPHAADRRMVNGREMYYGSSPGISTVSYSDRGLGYVVTSDLDREALTRLLRASFQP